MLDTAPLLAATDFPPIRRGPLQTLQVNLGYLCNQRCLHCHVNAGPTRTELMDAETLDLVLEFAKQQGIQDLDLTGGAPEMNPHFRELVSRARAEGIQVTDRCNLTILMQPGYEDCAAFLAQHQVTITASLPCYSQKNVDQQRGDGVFEQSIRALQDLNALGYGLEDSGLVLNLVYNPTGPFLPPPQEALEAEYKTRLWKDYRIRFNHLFALTNLPIARFGSTLVSKGQFQSYLQLLKQNFAPANLDTLMCRSLISIDWQGYVYDCDFNQMLSMPLIATDRERPHLCDLLQQGLEGGPIAVGEHCYACAAGQGSSCGGALS